MKKVLVLAGLAAAAAVALVLTRKTPLELPEGPNGTWEPAESSR
jgi:hypothetical protein